MADDTARTRESSIDIIESGMASRQGQGISRRLLQKLQEEPGHQWKLYISWPQFAAAAAASWAPLGLVIWMSGRLHPDAALFKGALFFHLSSLVLGFGAVLVADYFVLLWLLRRCTLAETIRVAARLHLPIWIGVLGLMVSGMLLEPNLASGLTRVKLALVAVLVLNGLQALMLSKRMEESAGVLTVRLFAWGAMTATISQLCWWGAVWIGFWNAAHRH